MKKIVIITGLTGSGKSALALKLCKDYSGEIISADSVQIYKGLDIGSAKATREEMSNVSHHLIDILDFNQTFNVSEFVSKCDDALKEIINRGHIPFIVGGTGLYIKALIEGYNFSNAVGHEDFRKECEKLAKEKGNIKVWNMLKEINAEKANTVHPNNLKRVIRYLEIEKFGTKEEKRESILKDFDVLCVGIIEDRDKIYKKIDKRVDDMVNRGLETEVKKLISAGATRDMQSMNTIGYKEWFDYFEGRVSREKTVELIKQHSRNYCKRQLTFLKTIPNIQLLTLGEAEEKIREFLDDRDK